MKSIIVTALLMAHVYSIAFKLQPLQQFCLEIDGGVKYDISYVVTGVNNQLVKFSIKQNQKEIITKQDVVQSSFGVEIQQGKANLCWLTGDSEPKEIATDFFPSTDQYHTVIDKKDVHTVKKSLVKSLTDLAQISKNQEFHMERDGIHRAVLLQSERKIKWAGIIKIAFLLTSALVQLWIMKGFFKSAHPYQPVNM